VFPREQVVHRPGQLVREYRQGFGFAVFVLQLRKIFLAGLVLPQEEDRRFGKGPTQMHVADLLARGPESFPAGFLGALDQTAVRDEILHAGEAGDILNLLQHDQRENLATPRHGL
jgi:hypothetical protein